MAIRYRFIPFDPGIDPAVLLAQIVPKGSDVGRMLSDGRMQKPWATAVAHMGKLHAGCLLVQDGVRDPDFLEEHQAFYGKQHRPVEKNCIRVHAFSFSLTDFGGDESQILHLIDEAAATPDVYLGFITIRPLRHAPVAATILRPTPGDVSTIVDDFPVHIAGNEFCVTGAPFLQQDNAVGACAQASIWMALRTLRRRVGNAAFSPAELTIAATRYLASDRVFPGRNGLSALQMLEAVRFAGHDPLHLSIPTTKDIAQALDVSVAGAPYIESGLPVITLLLKRGSGHAVASIGLNWGPAPVVDQDVIRFPELPVPYMHSSAWVQGFVIHNDNSGPYVPLLSGDPEQAYCLEGVNGLIVPLPEEVYTTAAEAELLALKAFLIAAAFFSAPAGPGVKLPEVRFVLRPYLCQRHAFRRWAKNCGPLDPSIKSIYRIRELPKYLWVVEVHDRNKFDPSNQHSLSRCGEIVLDASADPFHGDSLLFVRVTHHLWPSLNTFKELLIEDGGDERVKAVAFESGNLCEAFFRPWLDQD